MAIVDWSMGVKASRLPDAGLVVDAKREHASKRVVAAMAGGLRHQREPDENYLLAARTPLSDLIRTPNPEQNLQPDRTTRARCRKRYFQPRQCGAASLPPWLLVTAAIQQPRR
jgi:hypothetical protein